MTTLRQTNFRAGELSPRLWGRTDLPVYSSGLRRCRGMVPLKSGAVMSRPGTTYVAGVKYVDAPSLGEERDTGQARLIPFSAGDGDFESYALEFGNRYVRFICNNARVLDGLGNVYEVPTPYSNVEVWQLQYAQVGDVLVLAHPNHDPFELRRSGHADWALSKFRFKAYEPMAVDIGIDPISYTTEWMLVLPDPWQVSKAYLVGDLVESSDKVYECVVEGSSAGGTGPSGTGEEIVDGGVTWRFVSAKYEPDTDHVAREWQWAWTALVKDTASGAVYETLSKPVTDYFNGNNIDEGGGPVSDLRDLWAVYPDMPLRLRRAAFTAPPVYPEGYNTYVVQEYLLYRGRGGLFGFVGSTKSLEFVDAGDEPNYAIQPPIGTEPFGEATEATGLAAPFDKRRVDRPSAVAYFQSRLFFGGPTRSPMDWHCSKSGDFQNWDAREYFDVAGEALHFQLAARRKERLRSFAPLGRQLMALSSSSPWSIAGDETSPLDYNHLNCDQVDEVGATSLPPLVIDGALLFARAKGRGVRALVPTQGELQGIDVSEIAQHFFTGKDADTATLLHPLGREKELVDWTYQEDPHGTVWAVRADGRLLSLTFTREAIGWALHRTDGDVESVCAIPEGDEDAVYLVVVRTLGDGTKHRYIERMTSRTVRGGAVVDDEPSLTTQPDDICVDSALAYLGAAGIETITGLEHLEGKSVWVLAQGREPIGPKTVEGGEVDIGEELEANVVTPVGPRLVLHVGLLFTPEIETLDVASGDARLREKTIAEVGLEVDESRGLKVGMDFTDMDEGQLRDLDDDYNPISNATGLLVMSVPSEWNKNARIAMRQEKPLPVTVLALAREVV